MPERKRLPKLLQCLAEDNDRRSIGRSNEMVDMVLASPSLIEDLFSGIENKDSVLRMRAADLLEKVSAVQVELIRTESARILEIAEHETQHEVRWHLAQMIPRLKLTKAQKARAVSVLFDYLEDQKSVIVRTCAMEALFRLALGDSALMGKVRLIVMERMAQGKPAERARARKLWAECRSVQ